MTRVKVNYLTQEALDATKSWVVRIEGYTLDHKQRAVALPLINKRQEMSSGAFVSAVKRRLKSAGLPLPEEDEDELQLDT